MPAWFWLNVPADVLFFLAVSGIPLWMVLKKPATRLDDTPRGRENGSHAALRSPG
jgi:hypothetical protein